MMMMMNNIYKQQQNNMFNITKQPTTFHMKVDAVKFQYIILKTEKYKIIHNMMLRNVKKIIDINNYLLQNKRFLTILKDGRGMEFSFHSNLMMLIMKKKLTE